ncbi:P6 [Hamiltonella phage APSE-1]|uniref:Putative protein p6 n=1 Tax=Acyrthosiphon pisum secondary endosymbiont phage 1 TaxID=2682836 RepID=VP06_BPAPS|nr:hypothetical protein APSE-1_06 [Hamiltonella phage APSE-1]Q9T1U2.1 RecName: Full=Putative protein p6 [Hamiltonella phage APSE-1]AAF03949.1 P6 [Hamiltonella phage APSE-1]
MFHQAKSPTHSTLTNFLRTALILFPLFCGEYILTSGSMSNRTASSDKHPSIKPSAISNFARISPSSTRRRRAMARFE